MCRIIIFCLLFLISPLGAQNQQEPDLTETHKHFSLGANLGIAWAFEDKAHLLNANAGLTIDYLIISNYYLQLAPKYSWLWKWNEHCLTLPVHFRMKFGNRFSLFAGPALTFDIGNYRDLGVSFGASYDLKGKSSIILSAFTFTLYDYPIDYLYSSWIILQLYLLLAVANLIRYIIGSL